jgi:hypothetical protein
LFSTWDELPLYRSQCLLLYIPPFLTIFPHRDTIHAVVFLSLKSLISFSQSYFFLSLYLRFLTCSLINIHCRYYNLLSISLIFIISEYNSNVWAASLWFLICSCTIFFLEILYSYHHTNITNPISFLSNPIYIYLSIHPPFYLPFCLYFLSFYPFIYLSIPCLYLTRNSRPAHLLFLYIIFLFCNHFFYCPIPYYKINYVWYIINTLLPVMFPLSFFFCRLSSLSRE